MSSVYVQKLVAFESNPGKGGSRIPEPGQSIDLLSQPLRFDCTIAGLIGNLKVRQIRMGTREVYGGEAIPLNLIPKCCFPFGHGKAGEYISFLLEMVEDADPLVYLILRDDWRKDETSDVLKALTDIRAIAEAGKAPTR